jgi:hypothetical protein
VSCILADPARDFGHQCKAGYYGPELRSALSTLETSARVQKNRKYVRPIAIVFIVDTHQQMHARGNTLTSPPPPAILHRFGQWK